MQTLYRDSCRLGRLLNLALGLPYGLDPAYCDGEGAESFSALLQRAKAALNRLKAMPEDALAYVFSHGQFIQAVRSLVVDFELSERQKMRKFWGKGSPAIGNAELVELSVEDGVWWNFPVGNSRLASVR